MMKTIRFILCSLLCALFFSSNAFAQLDEREPGLYAIVGDESIPLTYSSGIQHSSSTGILGVELGKLKCTYSGPSSGVEACDTFVMVIDPEKKRIERKLKSYNPFINTMNPNNILVLPLFVENGKRVYDEGRTFAGINVSTRGRMDFEWEQISENSFEIRVKDLVPGEYGFVFRAAKLAEFSYDAIFGFTYAR